MGLRNEFASMKHNAKQHETSLDGNGLHKRVDFDNSGSRGELYFNYTIGNETIVLNVTAVCYKDAW